MHGALKVVLAAVLPRDACYGFPVPRGTSDEVGVEGAHITREQRLQDLLAEWEHAIHFRPAAAHTFRQKQRDNGRDNFKNTWSFLAGSSRERTYVG